MARRRTPLDRMKHAAEYAALRSVDALLRLVSLDRASAMMGWLWQTLAPLNRRHARAEANLRLALPELSDAERRAILKAMWNNLGRTAAETLRLDEILTEPERIATSRRADEAARPERGTVFVSLHTGNWELVAAPLALAGTPAHAVYKRLKNPRSEALLKTRRAGLYADLLPLNRLAPMALRAILRRGGSIAMMADLHDRRGTLVPFFGHAALANAAPALVARSLGADLVAARCVRLGGARFRIETARIPPVRTSDARADAEAMTAHVHRQFEAWIRERPGEWMWGNRKWPDALGGDA